MDSNTRAYWLINNGVVVLIGIKDVLRMHSIYNLVHTQENLCSY